MKGANIMQGVKLSEIVESLKLNIVHKSTNFYDIVIKNSEVNRPGLQLSGFIKEYPYKRIQIIGSAETAYLRELDEDVRYERLSKVLSKEIPCLIFAHGTEVPEVVKELAEKYDNTILTTEKPTTAFISKLSQELEYEFSEEITMHACLMEIYGMGVLLTGKSSVGKSETTLDLVIRGHRLVADDVVEVKKLEEGLRGQSPANIRHFLEIRGLGILDIQRLYGVGAVKTFTYIDLVVELEQWDSEKEYDRIGLDEEYIEILGKKVERITIPVKPGRNIAMIVEVAVRNRRQKSLGYNAAVELNKRLIADMTEKSKS